MGDSPIRRSQLITPFGIGALYVSKDGEGIITAGLDHWYKKPGGQDTEFIEEFKFPEWRLEKQLAVSHFRLPPDFRHPFSNFWSSNEDPNVNLSIPFLRFPRWHFCSFCRKLWKVPLSKRGDVVCQECTKKVVDKSKNKYYQKEMIQVQIIAVCDHGHIQDFPWNEWVHRTSNPICNGNNLKFISKGTPGLLGMSVKCGESGCTATERSLGGVLSGQKGQGGIYRTNLSTTLNENKEEFLCQGMRTWNGDKEGSNCQSHLLGSLRASQNIYFSKIESSIFVPIENNDIISNIIELFSKSKPRTIIDMYLDMNDQIPINAFRTGSLKKMFISYSDEDIKKALDKYLGDNEEGDEDKELNEIDFRRPEYNLFNQENNFEKIRTELRKIDEYNQIIAKYFSKITLVKKLTETKALYGFTRINTQTDLTKRQLKEYLWKEQPAFKDSWLPAIQVSGEGIFFNFREDLVSDFEKKSDVLNRISKYINTPRNRPADELKTTARYMMLHTFAHIMINTFIFECGYGAASLQERIYCSSDPSKPMAGVLIYTAAGDSEGTMGGLVRMGNPDFLERIIEKAIESSTWCSVDPVCMEISETGGQGPDSLNLAACHNCGLVPETSCEAFNSYLDRAMLTGTIENKKIGFFS